MSKLRKSAKNQPCMVRIPNVCNFNPETTVMAHVNGGGMGMKASDLHGAYCCSSCHDVLDGRVKFAGYSKDELKLMHLEGVLRTQLIMMDNGLIITADTRGKA